MSTDFSQLFAFLRGLDTAGANVEADIKAAARRRAEAIKSGIQQRLPGKGDTPYATGAEREHVVVVEDIEHKQYRVEVSDIPGRDPMVVVYHEFGTVGTSAHPAFRPAVDENRSGYLKDAENAVKKRFNEAG
jgi:hypothetical protein